MLDDSQRACIARHASQAWIATADTHTHTHKRAHTHTHTHTHTHHHHIAQDTLGSTLKATGVDLDSLSKTTAAVTKTANEGVTVAKPLLSQAYSFLTTTEPVSRRCGAGRAPRAAQQLRCAV
jgi:hypothetical protein